MKNISVRTIEHSDQRYNTVGDYLTNNDGININVSTMTDDRYTILISVHELIEAVLCSYRKISDKEIDNFDMKFEQYQNSIDTTVEPGADRKAPYHKEHVFAEKIEKLLAEELDVSWEDYCHACETMTRAYRKLHNK